MTRAERTELLKSLIEREEGASIVELIEAIGERTAVYRIIWSLEKEGYQITKTRDAGGKTSAARVYGTRVLPVSNTQE